MFYSGMSAEQLDALESKLKEQYNGFVARKLSLDLSRGKPGKTQLNI